MSAYHEKYLGEPGPTDVLSFPMDELRPPADGEEPPAGLLGDIVLCPAVTERQAQEHQRTPNEEAEYLLVHGLLHLLGYDHATARRPRGNVRPHRQDHLGLGSAASGPAQRFMMTSADWLQLGIAFVLMILAGLIAAAEAALSSFSKARANRLVEEGRPGAQRVRKIVEDPPRYLNTALFVRSMIEISAIILVANVIFSLIPKTWQAGAVTAGIMIIVSYIAWGVAPRTLGRQHADRVACAAAGPLVAITTVLGPFPRLLIMIGNALTPGRGFTDGPFATEAELRELVDLAEARDEIESGERKMIHSVFDLGDTIAREVMVPRTDMVFIEEYKTLRQAVSLALRSGFSRIPVIREGIDDVVGVLYLKDVIRRIYDATGRPVHRAGRLDDPFSRLLPGLQAG